MSALAIKENAWRRNSILFDCCVPTPHTWLSTHGQPRIFDCSPCSIECPVDAVGVTVNNTTTASLVAEHTQQSSGSYVFPSIDIAQGTNASTVIKLYAVNQAATVSSAAIVGDSASVPPATPATVNTGAAYTVNAVLNTATLGTKSVTILITTACGLVSFTQPYNVV